MRVHFAVLAWLLCCVQLTALDRAATAADEDAIRAIVKSYLDSRERRDETTLRSLFTADVDQLTSSGEWRKGREAVVTGTLGSSQRTTGTRTITIETVRFPAPDVAVADGRYEIAGGQQAARRMWTSFVLIRQGGAWRIAAIRNMLPAAGA